MELLLTVAALVAAIYAVVPRERQLDLLLRIKFFDWLLLISTFFLVLYLEFNEFFSVRGWVFHRPWPQGITPQNTIYLVIALSTITLIVSLRFSRLSRNKIGRFRELFERLYWDESYGELFAILTTNIDSLFELAQPSWSDRLRSALNRTRGTISVDETIRLLDQAMGSTGISQNDGLLPRLTNRLQKLAARPLLFCLPDYGESQQAAKELLGGFLLSQRLMKVLVRTRPYLGLSVIQKWGEAYERRQFIHLYMGESMRETSSVLYQELADSDSISSGTYTIPDTRRVLFLLFSDAGFAKENDIYKPVGDYALAYLDLLGRDPTSDPYNQSPEQIPDWSPDSPLHASVRFFDIMVRAALYQGMQWHMWLFYFPLIIKKIVRNYRLADPFANPEDEFPIKYSFILYQMFSTLEDWIRELWRIPLDQANVVLSSTRGDHENGNIPKSSILALGQCTRTVLECDNLTPKMKNYLVETVFDLYFELIEFPDVRVQQYATVLRRAVHQGGTYKPRNDGRYDALLIECFEGLQKEYRIKHSDLMVNELRHSLEGI